MTGSYQVARAGSSHARDRDGVPVADRQLRARIPVFAADETERCDAAPLERARNRGEPPDLLPVANERGAGRRLRTLERQLHELPVDVPARRPTRDDLLPE